jgi:hypothetical protein
LLKNTSRRSGTYFTLEIFLLSCYSRFLVRRLLAAPTAEFLELYLSLNLLLVPMSIVIPPFADGAPHRYQIVGIFNLCHGENDNALRRK